MKNLRYYFLKKCHFEIFMNYDFKHSKQECEADLPVTRLN